jgi:hypothetical protein
MLIHVRSIAVSTSALSFFGIAIIGWFSGLSPFTCCKRATAGAVIAYIAAAFTVKAINAILMSALVTTYINKQKEKYGGGTNI